jgi:hypothetical protein
VSLTTYLLICGLFLAQTPFEFGPQLGGSSGSQPEPGEESHFDITVDYGDLAPKTIMWRGVIFFSWCLFFLAAAGVVGLLPAMLLYLIGYMRFEGREGWRMTLAVAAPTWILSYILFHMVLTIPWPQALLGDWLIFLRSSNWFNLL